MRELSVGENPSAAEAQGRAIKWPHGDSTASDFNPIVEGAFK